MKILARDCCLVASATPSTSGTDQGHWETRKRQEREKNVCPRLPTTCSVRESSITCLECHFKKAAGLV